jgi:hypothetical protein
MHGHWSLQTIMEGNLRRIWRLMVRTYQVFRTPIAEQSLCERYIRALLFWATPLILWDVVRAGGLKSADDLGFVVLLSVIPAFLGAFVYAVGEHWRFQRRRRTP